MYVPLRIFELFVQRIVDVTGGADDPFGVWIPGVSDDSALDYSIVRGVVVRGYCSPPKYSPMKAESSSLPSKSRAAKRPLPAPERVDSEMYVCSSAGSERITELRGRSGRDEVLVDVGLDRRGLRVARRDEALGGASDSALYMLCVSGAAFC